MARRRRSRGVWFPNLGTSSGDPENVDDDDQGVFFQFIMPSVPNGGAFATQQIILPLTFDSIQEDEADEINTSLSDLVGSEYVLRRIVGDVFLARDTSFNQGATYAAIRVGCGFFVARQADVGQSRDRPIGAETAAESRENYSVLGTSTVREPWIWRKTWILGNAGRVSASADPIIAAVNNFPPNNTLYNGAMSNSRIDAKTIRRVGQDDRLFFVATARGLNPQFAGEGVHPFINDQGITVTATGIEGVLDYRLFGSLRRARQVGRF